MSVRRSHFAEQQHLLPLFLATPFGELTFGEMTFGELTYGEMTMGRRIDIRRFGIRRNDICRIVRTPSNRMTYLLKYYVSAFANTKLDHTLPIRYNNFTR